MRRTTWIWLIGAVAAWAAAPAPLVRAETLRWKLAEGDQLRWTFQQRTETETGVLGSSKPIVKVLLDMTVEASWLVEAADGEQFTVRQTIDAVKLTMNAPPGDPVIYDSASDEPPDTKAARELSEKLGPLIGAEMTLKLTARGEVLSADLSPQVAEALGSSEPDSLKQILRGPLLTLPTGAVNEGAKWKDEATMNVALGELKVRRNYTLEKEEDGVQVISLDGSLALTPADREDGAVVRLRGQELKGEVRFDAAAGRLVRSEISQSTLTDSTYRDSRVAVRAKSTLVTQVRKP